MAIDDPIDAIKKQLELEEASSSVIGQRLLDLLKLLPFAWPMSAAVAGITDALCRDENHRINVYLETVASAVQKHDKELREVRSRLDDQEAFRRAESTRRLLLEGARRASSTRSIERVQRIAIILANGVTERQGPEEDEIEEMMRIARELSDRDIEYLSELLRIHGESVKQGGRIERYNAYTRWESGFWGSKVNGEIDSVFSKLESFGLVSRIPPPNNLNIMADFQNRYALLPKGLRFSELVNANASHAAGHR
jgi:hypothetical protein